MKKAASALVFLFAMTTQAAVEMTVQKEAFVIHSTSISCMAYQDGSNRRDIASPYIDIPQIRIANRSGEFFAPAMIQVTFKSSIRSYTCTYSDYQLDAIGIPVRMTNNEILDLTCPIKCGGLPIGSPEKVTATVELIGYTESGNGHMTPVKIQKKMDIINPN
ncbi:hypothetical protein [Bdellovibrio bacteriovorus]|uniref:Bdellovibrio beta-sandwich domain-containing protein n=1 Tax=Bdellovibrio bacteriovorus str. Tiberius TaxID=1069642 RepID=K7ZGS8_BDEBC|nr:hypothetical protein [Bdellovibrio bacteriovorus]AFY02792.1 hypothetical protein Bdt_3117 [Bdellovibrio bacteriovorus str. Tiberius]